MKNYTIFTVLILIFVGCSQKTTDQKVLETTLDFLLKKNKNNEISIFNEIGNFKEPIDLKLKNIKIITCKEIFDKNELNFYVLKFNHATQKETTIDVINYNTLESFKLKFDNNNTAKPNQEFLHFDGLDRPRMIFLKQLRKQKAYSNDEGLKYVDSFPSDSIICK
ncbi:TPA: hypothetical protein ACG0AB_001080 [Elizabethkingia anophelis]|uniref:hypothetical protein n=1 Tax=Elizabethkingia TaxID=308865 RepID=UPI0016281262|nr:MULTISPECIES: hypothetical protein [Elizabethkingia]MCT3673799.1 hypothetical protein [Elizabethkingia anophelis]MCT3681166.1 hypothetical protein [Elizabethkingia anophelis]MCT3701495.1 hypothetical protein [Elizabethkingia anophelis]MCT3770253.1 hypothetical protein [Elizabethkingia anophelis]MCT3780215.1 hypothetical protein [Elizabethkingia anophelis]